MGRYYTVTFSAVAVTAVQDLFEIVAPANAAAFITLHEIRLIQTSDNAAADSEMLRVQIKRGTSGSTSGSGGTAPTPAIVQAGDPAATFTAEANNTTQATGGTITVMWEGGYNVLGEYVWGPSIPPDKKPRFSKGERCLVSLPVAPADSLTMSGTVVIEEG